MCGNMCPHMLAHACLPMGESREGGRDKGMRKKGGKERQRERKCAQV